MKKHINTLLIALFAGTLFAQTNSNTVVSTHLLPSAPDGTTSPETIKAGEPIYAMIYLDKTFRQLVGSGYNVKIREGIYIGNALASQYDWKMSYTAVDGQGSSYEIQMAPSMDAIQYPIEAYSLTKSLLMLPAGIHEVTLEVTYQLDGISETNTLGEVTFLFDNTNESGRQEFRNMVEAYRSGALKSVKLPESRMNNPELEKSVKQAVVDAGWSQTPLKVIIMEYDWSTLNDRYTGAILQRQINVAVATKDHNGFCQLFYPTVFQEYMGGGKYSTKTTLGGIHRIEEDIDCGNVQ